MADGEAAPSRQGPCVESLMPWEFPDELAAAARAGDLARCKALVAASPSTVDCADSAQNGFTALCWAAWEGHNDVIAVLLGAGADPNVSDSDGQTPLFNASWHGHAECVSTLLCSGANPSTADKEGDTPLIAAAKRGHYGICQRLAMAGADPTRRDEDGLTARDHAARAGKAALAQGLLVYEQKWADLQQRRAEEHERRRQESLRRRAELAHRYAQWLARREQDCAHERFQIEMEEGHIRMGVQRTERELREAAGRTAAGNRLQMHFNARRAACEVAEASGRAVLGKEEGRLRGEMASALCSASWAPIEADTVRPAPAMPQPACAPAGPEPEPECVFDESSVEDQLARIIWETQGRVGSIDGLRWQCKDSQPSAAGASSAATGSTRAARRRSSGSRHGPTLQALCEAARNGDLPRCQALVAMGVPVDPPEGASVQTPLMWAAVGGHQATAEWLLGAGACPRRRDHCGYSAPFHAVHHGNEPVLRYLCAAGADPRQRDCEGHDLVHWAAFVGSTTMLEFLINELGLSVAVRDSDGRTALHWAARQGHTEAVELLLRADSGLRSAADRAGMTPVDHAVERFHRAAAAALQRGGDAQGGTAGAGVVRSATCQARAQPALGGGVYRHM